MNKPKLIIYGIGSMAKVYAMYLQEQYDIVAYTVEKELLNSDHFNGAPLIPFERAETLYATSQYRMVVAIGYVELNQLRQSIVTKAEQKGYQLASYISPTIKCGSKLNIGKNSVILDNGSVHTGSQIGNNVFISSGVHIGHDCVIGDNVWINAGVCIGGGTTISSNTFIGMNATVSHGISVGEKNFIGASTLLTKSTEPNRVTISAPGEIVPLDSETFLRFSKRMNNA